MILLNRQQTIIIFILSIYVESYLTFDDDEIDNHHEKAAVHEGPLPQDKILLKDVKTLTFRRHMRTTSRRTHSIHQLSCVGGTAGCKLFTPNVVECENVGFNEGKSKFDWRCHAELSNRVRFNHVEVICEGYDYPEDDYILLGSCGLEFTLDYADPQDFHDKSYYQHMDEHEKELHQQRTSSSIKKKPIALIGHINYINDLVDIITKHIYLFGTFSILALCSFLLVRYFATNSNGNKNKKLKSTTYGPLASAVLTTKKAC